MSGSDNNDAQKSHVRVITFARTFSEKAHAQAFLNGQVRMQTVKHFRKLEDSRNALRGDAYEGISAIWQPSRLDGIQIGPHKILPSDLAGPLQLRDAETDAWHVFCMHTIGVTPEDPCNWETPEDYKKTLLLDERCADFGEHLVVLTSCEKFLDRLLAAIPRRFAFQTGLVSYFSELVYSGLFPQDGVPFRKPMRFAYQKEYRIVVKTPPGVATPLFVEMGDISDIAQLSKFGELNSLLRLELPDGTRI